MFFSILFESPTYLKICLAAILGSMVGSFFNVVIYRMPRGESIVTPPSRCPVCQHRIKPWENIPLFSWLLLRGKCSGCQTKIGMQYPLIEALTGLTAALLTWDIIVHPNPIGTNIVYLYFALCLIPIVIIDFRHYLIPDALTLTGIPIALAASFLPNSRLLPWESLFGFLISGFFLWGIGALASWLLKKEAMGFGDVKLLALAGACFGWQSALIGLGIASILGTLFGLPMLWLKRLNQERHIPFGPFLCLGALLAFRFQEPIYNWFFA